MIKGYAGRVLEVDLRTRSFFFAPLDEEIARLYIGGKGYGTRLLYDRTPAGIDPLGPENLLIFATGPLNGSVAPQSNRFAVICKSPLTGGIGNATCGGSFALGMKKAGIDILIVKNRAERRLRLEIDGDRDAVEFLDADDLWGKGTYATQKLLSRKHQHAVIGPAGENLVLFAGIVSNERIAGRTGVGAVMGSKLLKAVSVRGSRKLDMEDPEKFKAYTKEVRKLFEDHPVLGESMKRFGTGGIAMPGCCLRASFLSRMPTCRAKSSSKMSVRCAGVANAASSAASTSLVGKCTASSARSSGSSRIFFRTSDGTTDRAR